MKNQNLLFPLKQSFNRRIFFFFTIKVFAFVSMFFLQPSLQAQKKDTIIYTQPNRIVELTFISARKYPDPDNQLTVDAIITDPNGRELRVPGFWEQGDKWIVKYSSHIIGTHRFRSECSEIDKGLNGITGKIEVVQDKRKSGL